MTLGGWTGVNRAPGANTYETNQVSVGNTATLIVDTRLSRRCVAVVNLGTTDVYLGFDGTVTTSTGVLLLGVKGATVILETTGPVYGIVASGSQSVAYADEYDA